MKKKLTIASILFALICALCAFAACSKKDVDPVVLNTADTEYTITDTSTLKDYMDYLKDKGEFNYSYSEGAYGAFLESVNGVANTTNCYWMIYTDDTENSSTEWGSYDYDGKTLGSANFGISDMPLKENTIYVFAYQSF